ncbi:unnamed protein product [Rhizophagus irregularis]|uniref:Uncharacterized protein n=1 Tax=Rhizophagus irregularis TaxID=588596 RepID=A0A916EJG7_9GLOM|nr:unnamed protein product [Rhizophagus irregularis]
MAALVASQDSSISLQSPNRRARSEIKISHPIAHGGSTRRGRDVVERMDQVVCDVADHRLHLAEYRAIEEERAGGNAVAPANRSKLPQAPIDRIQAAVIGNVMLGTFVQQLSTLQHINGSHSVPASFFATYRWMSPRFSSVITPDASASLIRAGK